MRLSVGRLTRAKEALRFQTGNVLKAIREDLSAGRLRHIEPDWRETLRVAEELSEKHTASLGTTAVDTWHVAAAVLVHAEVFWTFDGPQRKLAMATGRIPRVPDLSKQ